MRGEFIYRKGERGRNLYIIKRGVVQVLKNDIDQKDEKVCELTTNNFFGETALLSGIGR